MTDLGWAVQQAVFDALTAAAITSGGSAVPIISVIGEDQPFPFVHIGKDEVTDLGSKDASLEQHDATVNVATEGDSKSELRAIQGQVKDALWNQPLTATGAKLSNPELISTSSDQVDIDQFLGSQVFRILAQAV